MTRARSLIAVLATLIPVTFPIGVVIVTGHHADPCHSSQIVTCPR